MGTKSIFFILLLILMVIPLGSSLTLSQYDKNTSVLLTNTDTWFDISDDGAKLYSATNQQGHITEYNLTQTWVIPSAVYNQDINISQENGMNFSGIDIKQNYLFLLRQRDSSVGGTTGQVLRYNLTTPNRLENYVQQRINYTLLPSHEQIGIYVRDSGTGYFIARGGIGGNRPMTQYSMTNWDVSTSVSGTSISFSPTVYPHDIDFKGDGAEFYLTQGTVGGNFVLSKWEMSSLFTLSSAVNTENKSLLTNGTFIYRSVRLTPDNQKFIISSTSPPNSLYDEYTLQVSGGGGVDTGSFMGGIVNGLNNLYPDSDTITTTSRFGYVAVTLLLLTMLILIFGVAVQRSDLDNNRGLSPLILWSALLVNILGFFYFISISYIPVSVLVLLGLIFLGISYFKFFGNGGGN